MRNYISALLAFELVPDSWRYNFLVTMLLHSGVRYVQKCYVCQLLERVRYVAS